MTKLQLIEEPIPSDQFRFGGEPLQQIIMILSGEPLDTEENIRINTTFKFFSGKLALYDDDPLTSHLLVFKLENIASGANKSITIRNPTVDDDFMMTEQQNQIVKNKTFSTNNKVTADLSFMSAAITGATIDGSSNTFMNINQTALLKITDKTKLHDNLVYTDQANTFGDFNQIFRSGKLQVRNPANTFSYIITGSAIVADRTITIPLITSNGNLVLDNYSNIFTTTQSIEQNNLQMLRLYRTSNVANSSNTIFFEGQNNVTPTPERITFGQLNVLNSGIIDGLEEGLFRLTLIHLGTLSTVLEVTNGGMTLGVSPSKITLDLTGISTTRTLTFPNASGEVLLNSANQTITNKTQGAKDGANTFPYVRKYQSVESYGTIQLRGYDIVGEGHFEGIQYYGTLGSTDNDSTGYYQRVLSPSVSGGFAGLGHFSSNQASFRRDKNGWVICKHQLLSTDYPLSGERFFFGFYDQLALLPDSNTLLSNTQSGFFIAFRSGVDTNYMILHNDGTGTMQEFDTTQEFPTSSTIHELEIKMDSVTGITWIIRNIGGSILKQGTINTRIPANTTKLYFYYGVQGNGKTIFIRNCECKTGGH